MLYQTELIPVIHGPNGNRTRDSAVTGQCDNLFTMRPNWMLFVGCRSITPTCRSNHSYGSRTRVFAVKGRCLNHLTNERYEGIARVGISPTTLSLHVRYTIIILPANPDAAYTKQSRHFLSIPHLCTSDDTSNYIEISVDNSCLECCRRHSYASTGTCTL